MTYELGQRVSVGIDLSLTNTGIAIWTEGDDVGLHSIKSSGHKGDTLAQRYQRLNGIADEVMSSMPRAGKVSVCIEAPSFNSTGGHSHDRSGLWWTVLNALTAHEYPVTEVSPTQVKVFATGKGNASKGAVVDAVARRWPHVATNGDDNLADALVLATIGAAQRGFTDVVDLPLTHTRALDTIKWGWQRI